jgi:hypothetical protein
MTPKSNKKTQKKLVENNNSKKASKQNNRLKQLVDDVPSTEFDKVFEKKLAEQYRLFRGLKEHHLQTKKFIRILIVLLVIILLAVLLISFSV